MGSSNKFEDNTQIILKEVKIILFYLNMFFFQILLYSTTTCIWNFYDKTLPSNPTNKQKSMNLKNLKWETVSALRWTFHNRTSLKITTTMLKCLSFATVTFKMRQLNCHTWLWVPLEIVASVCPSLGSMVSQVHTSLGCME